MISTIRKFFAFCPKEHRAKFYKALVLGTLMAFFRALRIPAIAVMLMGVINGVETLHIVGSLALMLVSMTGEAFLRGR